MTTTSAARHPAISGTERTRLLAFADRQARPARLGIELDGDGRTTVPVCEYGPSHRLPASGWRLLDHPAWPQCAVPSETSTADRVLATVGSCGVQRYESRCAVNPHRGYAAAHCFFSAHVFLLAGGAAWHLDTSAETLRRTDPGVDHVDVLTPEAAAADGAVLAVLAHPGSIPPRYRDLRWALALCESGHLTELLVQVGRALGLAPHQRTDFDDSALLGALGLDAAEGWMPASIVELGAARVESGLTMPVPARPAHAPDPSADLPSDPVAAFDRSAWSGERRGVVRDRAVADLPSTAPTTWADVVYERSAGRGNKGFTAAPEPLGRKAVQSATTALAEALGAQPTPARGGVRVLLLSERVQDQPAGLYEVDGGGLRLLRTAGSGTSEAPGMRSVQRAFSYPETQMSVRSCPAAFVLTTDHGGLLDSGGARRLRTSQLDLGAAAQAAGLAMTAHGGFARPARSFDPDALAHDLDLPEGELPAYVVLLGESRFTDLLVDLRA